MNATLQIRFDDRAVILTARRSHNDAAAATTPNNTLRFEQLRRKLIQETESYLNNPGSQTWARAG
jgi:hypothetical protein